MRFGIGMNTDHTLEEVGQQFSVTRERIRQIEAKALRKLKHPSRSRKLRSFLDFTKPRLENVSLSEVANFMAGPFLKLNLPSQRMTKSDIGVKKYYAHAKQDV